MMIDEEMSVCVGSTHSTKLDGWPASQTELDDSFHCGK